MKKRPIDIKNILGMLSFCFAFFQYTWFIWSLFHSTWVNFKLASMGMNRAIHDQVHALPLYGSRRFLNSMIDRFIYLLYTQIWPELLLKKSLFDEGSHL